MGSTQDKPGIPGGIGNVYQDVFFAKNFSDLVTESFRNVWDLKVSPFCVDRLRVLLGVLSAFCLLYAVLWVTIKARDVIKCVLSVVLQICEEHLSSMHFCLSQMKLSLDLVGIAY